MSTSLPQPHTVAPLRTWLAGRPASERDTIARLWQLVPPPASADQLAAAMLHPAQVERLVHALSPQERAALELVQAEGGVVRAARLERSYGDIRLHTEYPNPRAYLLALTHPPGVAERLYLMALIQPLQSGNQRFYAIPPDVLALLPPVLPRDRTVRVFMAEPPATSEPGSLVAFERHLLALLATAQDGLLDIGAGGALKKSGLVRLGRAWGIGRDAVPGREERWPRARFVRQIAQGAGLVRLAADGLLRPTRESIGWMRQPALERARALLRGWAEGSWDELTTIVDLSIQKPYTRDVTVGKQALLTLAAQLPHDTWLVVDDIVQAIYAADADFARSDGNYDTWGITDAYRQPLDGFSHWYDVEGALIRAVLTCSWHWLGLTDIGPAGEEPEVVRFTGLGAALIHGVAAPPEPQPAALTVLPNYTVLVPPDAPLDARFQIGRIAERAADTPDTAAASYRLSKRSIQHALDNGIALADITRFLEQQSGRSVPQNVAVALRDWSNQHGRVRMRRAVLLEADDGLVLEQIRRDKRVRLPSVEPLGATALLISEGDAPALAERLRAAGYGLQGNAPLDAPLSQQDLTTVFAALEVYAAASAGRGGTAHAALRQRVRRLLTDVQLHRAYQMSQDVLRQIPQLAERADGNGEG